MNLELVRLTDSENERLGSALKDSKSPLSEILPDDINARELIAFMRDCVKTQGKIFKVANQVGALIGRGLALMKLRPEVLSATGYETLKEYEDAEIVGKLASHGSIWQHKRVIELYPGLSTDEIRTIGITKLTAGAQAIPKGASADQKREFLEQARAAQSVDEYREWIETKSGHGSPGSTKFDKFELMGPGDQVQELREFLAERPFIDWAGTDTPLGLCLAAIKESTTQWQVDEPHVPLVDAAVVDGPEEEAEDGIAPSDAAEDWEI